MRLAHMAPLSKNKGSYHREANTHPLCRRILPFSRFNRRFVHRSSPIGNRLRIFRGQDGKWRNSQSERHDRSSPNSSNWNVGARNQPAQWSHGGGPHQRSRTIRARPGHRRDASGSPRVRLLGSGARDTRRHRPPWLTFQRWLTVAVTVGTDSVESRCDAVALGSNISVAAPFVGRCLTSSTMAPFPHLAHRTGRARLRHPALGQDLTPSPTARRVQAGSGARARSARKDARVDKSRPCVAWFCA